MTQRRIDTLMFAGVFAAPVAWTLQHLGGFALSEAKCDPAGRQWGVAYSTWMIPLTAATAAVAIGGLLAAIAAYRAVKDEGGKNADPPPGRVWLMATCGIVISPIITAIILLEGIGTLILGTCHQS